MACVTRNALVSALALRMRRDNLVPAPADVGALLDLGCSYDEIAAAFAQAGCAEQTRAGALVVLNEVVERREATRAADARP